MTLAHQCQITQLKDTYKEKLQNAELSPEKLTEELNKEREKFRLEMQKKESEMNQNFKMVDLYLIIGKFLFKYLSQIIVFY
jgi:hypothetical protein